MDLSDIQQAVGLKSPIRHQLFINGEFVDALSGETLATLNPHDNSVIAQVAMAGHADVDLAVKAAQQAFPAWSRMQAADRGRILLKLADLIEANGEELARLESLDTGHPIRDCRMLDVPRTAGCFRYFGGMADKFQGETIPVDAGFLNYTLREPLGVVGQVVPWNFPLMFTSWKMAPALAAGNTIVLKPAEITPLTTLKIAELMREAGMPAGVVNILPGPTCCRGQPGRSAASGVQRHGDRRRRHHVPMEPQVYKRAGRSRCARARPCRFGSAKKHLDRRLARSRQNRR